MKLRIRTNLEIVSALFVVGLAACSGSSDSVYQGGGGTGGRSGSGGSSNPNCATKTTCFEKCMCEGGKSANPTACVTMCNASGGSGAAGGFGGAGGVGGAPPGQCGNGIIEGNELCDNMDLRGETCSRVTMGARTGGVLRCTPTCTFDINGCTGGATGGAGGVGGMAGSGGLAGGGGLGP